MNDAIVKAAVGVSTALAVFAVGIIVVTRAPAAPAQTKPETIGALAPTESALPPPPPEKTLEDVMDEQATYPAAVATAKSYMDDRFGKDSVGTEILAVWATKHLQWSDVGVAQDETTGALVKKDVDEERGKRMCVGGSIVQIEVIKPSGRKMGVGLLSGWSGTLVRFFAAGSSGTVVENSESRICGTVTGIYDYGNSGGGVGHAVTMVGMFDLPENKKKKPLAGMTIAAPSR